MLQILLLKIMIECTDTKGVNKKNELLPLKLAKFSTVFQILVRESNVLLAFI